MIGDSNWNASIDHPDRDVSGVAGAPARDDRDVVERVGAAGALGDADLYLSHARNPTGGAGPRPRQGRDDDLAAVVGGLDDHLEVVRVALLEAGRGDADELALAPSARRPCGRRRRTSTGAGRR